MKKFLLHPSSLDVPPSSFSPTCGVGKTYPGFSFSLPCARCSVLKDCTGYQTSTMVTILLIAQIITILNHYRPRLWKIFIVLSLFLMTYALLLTHGQTIRIAKNHHLDWPITRYPLFVILWTTLFFYTIGCSPTSSISFLIISIFFYMICLFTYWKQGTFGSMWCWISNTMFLVFILQDLFLRPCL